MNNEMGGSKTDTLIKLVLTFFVALLAFSVGTYVGKQVSDSDYKRAALEEDYNKDRDPASEDQTGQDSLTEEDIANLTEEFVASEQDELAEEPAPHKAEASAEQQGQQAQNNPEGYKKYPREGGKESHGTETQAQAQAKAEDHTPEAKVEPVSEAAVRVAAGESPTKTHKKERQPNSILPSVATSAIGKYTVQVASYPEENQAKSHAAKLKGRGWNAFYIPAEVKGKTWYRVSVGLFTNQASASNFRAELLKENDVSAAIIQKIVR